MKITVEFDSYEEFLGLVARPAPPPVGDGEVLFPHPTFTPPVDNEHVAPGAEQFSPPAEKPKRTRRTKAEMEAAKAAETPPPAETAAIKDEFEDEPLATQGDDFLDEPVAPAVKATKDDVRAALVAYQERLVQGGTALETARTTVLALLKKVSGADKLGGCPEDKFEAVINAAKAAK